VTVEHLEQHPGAATGGVLLLAGDLVGRAHDGAAVVLVLAALADADAPIRGLSEAAAVVGEPEEQRFALAGRPVAPQPQMGVEGCGIDDLAGVHPGGRIEQVLELTEEPDDLVAEHAGKQLTAGLAVAVLAGQGSAVADDQVGGAFHEAAVGGYSFGAVEVEGDPGVHAPLAEVSVQAGAGVAGVTKLPIQGT